MVGSGRGPAYVPARAGTGGRVIVDRLDRPPAGLDQRTGWEVKPEGACRGDVCVPLASPFDLRDLARRLGMELVHDEQHGVWALGPESGGRALHTAELPDIVLPDRNGEDFSLRSLRGTKVCMIAWASW
jgi:hypothetical protein